MKTINIFERKSLSSAKLFKTESAVNSREIHGSLRVELELFQLGEKCVRGQDLSLLIQQASNICFDFKDHSKAALLILLLATAEL